MNGSAVADNNKTFCVCRNERAARKKRQNDKSPWNIMTRRVESSFKAGRLYKLHNKKSFPHALLSLFSHSANETSIISVITPLSFPIHGTASLIIFLQPHPCLYDVHL